MSKSTAAPRKRIYQLPDTVTGPGQFEDLPVPFMPTPDLQVTRKQFQVIVQHPAFKILPRILIPCPTAAILPPVMHYAWPANRKLLWTYAKKHNLIQYYPGRRLPCGRVVRDVSDDEDYRGKEDPGKKKIRESRRVDRARTVEHALVTIADNLGCKWPRLRMLHIDTALQAQSPFIVSLYTNYDLYNTPSKEDIEKLRVELGAAQAEWYMCGSDAYWTLNRSRR